MGKQEGCYACGDRTRLLGSGFGELSADMKGEDTGKPLFLRVMFTEHKEGESVNLCPVCVASALTSLVLGLEDIHNEAKASNTLSS